MSTDTEAANRAWREARRREELQKAQQRWLEASGCGKFTQHLTLRRPGAVPEIRAAYGMRRLPMGIAERVEGGGELADAIEALCAFRFTEGRALYLHGDVGTGKTNLLWALCNDTIRYAEHRCRFVSAVRYGQPGR